MNAVHLAQEVLGAGALEGAPAAAARPIAVYERVVQVQHQRPHMPAQRTQAAKPSKQQGHEISLKKAQATRAAGLRSCKDCQDSTAGHAHVHTVTNNCGGEAMPVR